MEVREWKNKYDQKRRDSTTESSKAERFEEVNTSDREIITNP